MKKIKIIVGLSIVLIIIGFLIFVAIGFITPQKGALLIESSPSSTVLINGQQVGRTPFEIKYKIGEVTIKLIPESVSEPLSPYETKILVVPGIKTVVRRLIGNSLHTSAGEEISFEKTGAEGADMSLVSSPDTAQVRIDGQIRGFAPLKISNLTPGKHEVKVSAEGYAERIFLVEAKNGYRLTIVVKLAGDAGQQTPSLITGTPTPTSVPFDLEVTILDTGVGFLRVRKEPSTSATEIGRVMPGEKYKVLETDPKTGWYKIEFQKEKEGWISNQYVKKVTPKPSLTPTPTKSS